MRTKINRQPEFNFHPSKLKITNEYYEKYEQMSRILEENPQIVNLAHKDLEEPLKYAEVEDREGSVFKYTSDTVVRIVLCMIIEGASLRQIVIRIDDSQYLRWFVRIYNGPMMDFTTLAKLKNSIRPSTWKRINKALAEAAVREGMISGEQLRLDTTAVETNIHWPTDSSLLWDSYRVLGRLIEQARELDPKVVGDRRLLKKKVKRLAAKIARRASKNARHAATLKPLYEQLIGLLEGICEWSGSVAEGLEARLRRRCCAECETIMAEVLVERIHEYRELAQRVIHQARLRVLDGVAVPNEEKIFSIFEPHTELLKRGKAGKNIEFGHMIQIQQVTEKFITDYEVFSKKPVEHELLDSAVESHRKLFGEYPEEVAADKGYWQNSQAIEELERKVELVSIAKKGRRTDVEIERETDPAFRHAQRFRAGVEGSISFLKRVLRLCRCYAKGWEHYVCTVGATIFAHNLLILARC